MPNTLPDNLLTLLAKVNTGAYGTDPTPDGSNAIRTRGLNWDPYDGPVVSEDIDRQTHGAQRQVNTNPSTPYNFETLLHGGGAVDTPPNFGALLRMCKTVETITAATDVQYAPTSEPAQYEDGALYGYEDDEEQKALGVRGTWDARFQRGQLPVFRWQVRGLYSKAAVQAPATPAATGLADALPITEANTDVTLHGHAIHIESIELRGGVGTDHINTSDLNEICFTGHEAGGTISFLAPRFADKDYFAAVESHTGAIVLSPLQIVHGTVGGNIAQFDAAKTQLSNFRKTRQNGKLVYQFDMAFIPTDGLNDDYLWTFK